MNAQEIKTAIREGKRVFWSNLTYEVKLHIFKGGEEQWNIICSENSHCIGLTWQDGTTLNGKPEDFFIITEELDLLEKYELLPQNVQDLLLTFEGDANYEDCEKIKSQLLELGYSVDYDLSGELLNLLPIEPEKVENKIHPTDSKFPNGFNSWIETYYEVCAHIFATLDVVGSIAYIRQEEQGRGGLYEMAEEITNEFEKLNTGREWDGEFFDELDTFIESKEII